MNESAAPNLIDMLAELPAPMQVVLVLGMGIGLAIMTWKKFFRQLHSSNTPTLAFGDEQAVTDISDLIKNVDLLTLQMMKSEAAFSSIVAALIETNQLIAAHFEELRIERVALKKERQDRDFEDEIARRVKEEVKNLEGRLRRPTRTRQRKPATPK